MGKNLFSSSFGIFSWEYQSWDSEILERKTAKILSFEPKNKARGLAKELTKSLEREKVKYAIFRVNASNFSTIHALEDSGFRLVDGYLKLECEIKEESFSSKIREAKREDLNKLQAISSSSFSKTRFYNDPLIKKSQADKIYSEWIKNSILKKTADLVLVWVEESAIFGFTSIKKNGNIVLIAVSREKQGRGIGKLLVNAALKKFSEWGIKSSTIETQMTNISALRVYQSCGYKIVDSFLTFRWSYAN